MARILCEVRLLQGGRDMREITKRLSAMATLLVLSTAPVLAAPQNQSAPKAAPTGVEPRPGKLNPRTCPPNLEPVLLSPKDTGEMVEGPACVGVIVNVLRYSVEFGRSVTFTAGPSLAAGLAPPTTPGGGEEPKEVRTIAERIKSIVDRLTNDKNSFRQFDGLNTTATSTVTQASTDVKAAISASDDILRTSGAAAALRSVRDDRQQTEMRNAANTQWRAADQINQAVKGLNDEVSALLLGNPSDADKTTLTGIQTDISGFINEMTPSLLAGDKTTAFYKQKAIVQFWSRLLLDPALTEDSFIITTYVACPTTFNQNRQVAVKLLQYDRLPLFDGQVLSAVDVKDPFITVNCGSPFSVSAGIEFRFLKNQTFGLVPSGNMGNNVFDVTSDSKTTPLPIGMVHARLTDWANHKVGLHASFGVGAHIQGSSSGGSAAEFLTGLSLSLFRTIYITPGWHYGQVAALGGGYKKGDPVPMGVTTAPVTTSYQHGFGLAFTFTKP
jgi:hypothetical protein